MRFLRVARLLLLKTDTTKRSEGTSGAMAHLFDIPIWKHLGWRIVADKPMAKYETLARVNSGVVYRF